MPVTFPESQRGLAGETGRFAGPFERDVATLKTGTPLHRKGILRHSSWDAWFVLLALLHGAMLFIAPSALLIAIGFWWNTNTISHNFIHRPFFRLPVLNSIFSRYLSLVLGIPQTLWRQRHLAHHAEIAWHWRWSRPLALECGLVMALWGALLALVPHFFLTVYLPGVLLGLGLCYLQGHYEHALGATSHYGRIYNSLFFNDGFHVEHHARPGEHWLRLPSRKEPGANGSRWPAVLRWLEAASLDSLERLVLRSPRLQRFVLRSHERAFCKLLANLPPIRSVGIVGGGIFPRTALVLQRLLPGAHLRIIDANAENIREARDLIEGGVEFVHEFFDAAQPNGQVIDLDLLVIPLAFIGNRACLYSHPPVPLVVVHDWLWHRRDPSVVVSLPLLKRLNLVKRCDL